ncbi:unnamed protein product [Amoebophrya sp. A25]|nr:unnamed protein product [Amoebophrya sp. A25]|eukprot:GSA25T00012541001.1
MLAPLSLGLGKPAAAEDVGRRGDFKVICVLGSGGFGTVKLVHAKDDETELYAMKVIDKRHLIEHQLLDPNIKRLVETERELAAEFGAEKEPHPFIVQLHEAFQTKEKLYYVYEYLNGGELFDLVRVLKRFNVTQFGFYATEVVEALSFLHEKGILHRDVKLENVLLSADGHVKLCDFGCAKFFKKEFVAPASQSSATEDEPIPVGRTNTMLVVSRKSLMSPEYYDAGVYGVELDTWQLGLMFYTMLQGRSIDLYSPDLERPIDVSDVNARSGDASLEEISKQESISSLVNDLLNVNYKSRLGHPLGGSSVKEHPFFDDVDWAKVREKSWAMPPELDEAAVERIASTLLNGFHNDWGRDSTQVALSTDLFPVEGFSFGEGPQLSHTLQSVAKSMSMTRQKSIRDPHPRRKSIREDPGAPRGGMDEDLLTEGQEEDSDCDSTAAPEAKVQKKSDGAHPTLLEKTPATKSLQSHPDDAATPEKP